MNEENSEGAVQTPIGSVSFKGKRMAEFIAVFCLSLLLLFGYILWEHKAEAKQDNNNIAMAIREFTLAQKESTVVQRVTNCLMATRQEEREAKLAQCERIAR